MPQYSHFRNEQILCSQLVFLLKEVEITGNRRDRTLKTMNHVLKDVDYF